MQIIRGLHNFKRNEEGLVATIGNFDGVHIGHQAVINKLKERAKEFDLPSMLMIFEPQPEELFAREPKARLTRLREKIEIFQEHSIDKLLILPFNQKLAFLTADEFVERILFNKLKLKHLVIGDDFHFGQNRLGNFDYLKKIADKFRFTVESVPTYIFEHPIYGQRRVSSTWIREMLRMGEFKTAKELLGRDYSMCGNIVSGEKLGRKLGAPTINVNLHRRKSPLFGVYAVKVFGLEKNALNGVANIGVRPTVGTQKNKISFETHLFDFDKDVYGHYVKIVFLHKIRDEKKFDSIELLKEQIKKDIENTKEYFEKLK